MVSSSAYLDRTTKIVPKDFGHSIYEQMRAQVAGAHQGLLEELDRYRAEREEKLSYLKSLEQAGDDKDATSIIPAVVIIDEGRNIDDTSVDGIRAVRGSRHSRPKRRRNWKWWQKFRETRLAGYLYGKGFIDL